MRTLPSASLRAITIIVVLVGVISVLHYSTNIELHYFHELYKVLYYLPIIFAAVQFGVRGGLAVSFVVTIIYIPHVVFDWTGHPYIVLNRFAEMVVFNLVAFIAGRLVEKEKAERRRYERAAQELKESYEKLQRQAEQLTVIEEKLRSAERMATVGELAANLAHEVRNPLAAIKGAAEILRNDYPKNGRNREFVELLIRDVERMNQVIEGYLGFVRPIPGRRATFDAIAAARSTVQMLQAKARIEKKKLLCEADIDRAVVAGDETKYRQVLLNLFLNAFAAVAVGGTIRLRCREDPSAAGHLLVCIQDTGVGIPRDVMPHIFKPFYSTKSEGTGLGLAIAQRITKEFQWGLSIDSKPGEGTTATLRIPMQQTG